MAVIGDVRPLGSELERSYEVYVRGSLRFRVKQIVYVAFSLDETVMGFAFPKEERDALVTSEPHKFELPRESEMRLHWSTPTWQRSTRPKPANSSSTRGAWSCPRRCHAPTTSRTPTARGETAPPSLVDRPDSLPLHLRDVVEHPLNHLRRVAFPTDDFLDDPERVA